MTHIIDKSLSCGTMPTLCKKALVKPVYKGEGDKIDPGNYRPISILPLLGKCIEYFVNKDLMEYKHSNKILNDQQFGFCKDNSLIEYITQKKMVKKPTILFLDIKKAFDTVDHNILLRS